jgi:SAM-dependent methyltransferase
MKTLPDKSNPEAVRELVRDAYGSIAAKGGSCCGPQPTCCGSGPDASDDLAKHIGYSAEELAALPEGANLGLSCGNPNALAALKPGEVVLDLGSGGGFDVFIAGRAVGPAGRAIGVDMTAEMVSKARKNLGAYRERSGLDNVEFRLGEIEHLPVADNSVDVVISNCVINLSPDKPQVWREIARVLKPSGRVAGSDLALLKPLPAGVASMVEALVGCVAGAALVTDTGRMAREAGLTRIRLNERPAYIDGMVDWQDPLYQQIVAHLPAGTKASDYVTSLEVTAHKPAETIEPHSQSRTEAMTTYVYETIPPSADEKPEYFEVKQNMTDAALTKHPETGQPVRRVVLGGYGVLKSGAAAEKSGSSDGCGCGPGGCCG